MSDHPASPPAPDPWSFEEEDTPGQGRRWSLLLVGVVPWLVVAVLLLRPEPPVPGAPETLTGDPTAASLTDTPAPPGVEPSQGPDPAPPTPLPTSPPAGSTVDTTLVTSRARLAPDVGDAITVAVLVARSWFTGAGPTLAPADAELAPTQTGYVEHVWVEAVDRPWRDHVVVALGAVVLVPATEDGQDSLRPVGRRIAVPVRLDRSGARPAGAPWPLPDPRLTYDPLAFVAVDDEQLALSAAESLTDAGYDVHELVSLERSDGWPWRAVLEATAPDRGRAQRHTVWLRRHLAGFVVAGWLPPGPATDDDVHGDGDVTTDGDVHGDGAAHPAHEADTHGPAEPAASEDGAPVDEEEGP